MSTHATATFEVKSWDEQPYQEFEGGTKLTRASVTTSYHGDIEGEGTLEYLMFYGEDGSASFVGLERVVGRVGNRSGSFVLRHSGAYEGGTAKATYVVVPGSGTGACADCAARATSPCPGTRSTIPSRSTTTSGDDPAMANHLPTPSSRRSGSEDRADGPTRSE